MKQSEAFIYGFIDVNTLVETEGDYIWVTLPAGVKSKVPLSNQWQDKALFKGEVITELNEFPEALVPLAVPEIRYTSSPQFPAPKVV